MTVDLTGLLDLGLGLGGVLRGRTRYTDYQSSREVYEDKQVQGLGCRAQGIGLTVYGLFRMMRAIRSIALEGVCGLLRD